MRTKIVVPLLVIAAVLALPLVALAMTWSDNFDSYPTGQNMHGVGGWKGWLNDPTFTAFTTDVQARSAPNSVNIELDADLVHEYAGYNTGVWEYIAWQYVPADMVGTAYFIMLNTYSDAGDLNWSTQVQFSAQGGFVLDDGTGNFLPIITNEWVQLRNVIDLDNNTQTFYYGADMLYTGSWTEHISGGGALNIGAVDLFANGSTPVYYDDLSLLEAAAGAPAIQVDPTSLEQTLPVGGQATQTLDITNVGDGDLTWEIIEEAPPTAAPAARPASPGGTTERLGPTPPNPNPAEFVPTDDVIQDGGFEAGSPNPFWTEFSTNFGTPLCTIASCGTGTGTGPRSGTWWAWFGGISVYEEGSVSQDVTIPIGTATLTFWLEQIVCDSAADYIEVLMDGTQVFLSDGSSALCGNLGYTQQTVDVSAYADGGVHTVEFHSEIFANNGGGSNFFVDDVVLDAVAGGGACTPGDITWVSVDPTSGTAAAGETDTVDVMFDATGLSAGVYTGTLCVESNDAVNPTVLVDLTLTVVEPGAITVDPTELSSTQAPDTTVTQDLTISNAGPGDLEWLVVESDAGTCVAGDISWASVDPTSGTTAAGADSTVEVTFDSTGLTDGTYTAALCVQSNDPDNPEIVVPLTLNVSSVVEYWLYLPVVINAP